VFISRNEETVDRQEEDEFFEYLGGREDIPEESIPNQVQIILFQYDVVVL
jgi:hypothetical protein